MTMAEFNDGRRRDVYEQRVMNDCGSLHGCWLVIIQQHPMGEECSMQRFWRPNLGSVMARQMADGG